MWFSKLRSLLAHVVFVAQLAAAADRAGLDVPKGAAEAGVWVYSEAIPKGILTQEEAGLDIGIDIFLIQALTVGGDTEDQRGERNDSG